MGFDSLHCDQTLLGTSGSRSEQLPGASGSRSRYATVPRMGRNSANVDGRGSNPLGGTSRRKRRCRSQSVQGTAAAHTRARDGSIPSTATKFSRVARAVFPPHPPREPAPAIYIARAGARPRLQIGCGRVQILGGVRIVRFALPSKRAAVWQQSRWVVPNFSARQLLDLGVVQK